MNKIENYLGIANHDIQMANNSDELKSYVASLLCEIDKLQQEKKQLKEDIKNIINILNNNCNDLEATEEEFESLDRWQELEQGSDNESRVHLGITRPIRQFGKYYYKLLELIEEIETYPPDDETQKELYISRLKLTFNDALIQFNNIKNTQLELLNRGSGSDE